MAFLVLPGCVLLEYVPNALGARGANVPFCAWLLRLRRRGVDVRVMFHEPYFYFSWHRPWRNGLAVVQRLMAALLVRASSVAYLFDAGVAGLSLATRVVRHGRITDSGDDRNRGISRRHRRLAVSFPRRASRRAHRRSLRHVRRSRRTRADAHRPSYSRMPVPSARMVCIGRGGEAFVAAYSRREIPPSASGCRRRGYFPGWMCPPPFAPVTWSSSRSLTASRRRRTTSWPHWRMVSRSSRQTGADRADMAEEWRGQARAGRPTRTLLPLRQPRC